jgi:hypothetical protein
MLEVHAQELRELHIKQGMMYFMQPVREGLLLVEASLPVEL